eukprot:2292346-Karenia_brevis.AAC.1
MGQERKELGADIFGPVDIYDDMVLTLRYAASYPDKVEWQRFYNPLPRQSDHMYRVWMAAAVIPNSFTRKKVQNSIRKIGVQNGTNVGRLQLIYVTMACLVKPIAKWCRQ